MQNINNQTNSRFMPATDLKIGTFVLIPSFNTPKGISKKLQPLRKGPYQINEKPLEVTHKLTDTTKKEIVQHRNNLLPYYPKEYALRKLTQLYSFTGLKDVQNKTETEQNQTAYDKSNKKQIIAQNVTPQAAKIIEQKMNQKEKKNIKMTEKILPQDQKEKPEHIELSRLRSQPRKNYKSFIPQSKILNKVEFQQQLQSQIHKLYPFQSF